MCVSPRRSSAAVYWERESFPLVCELIFYELGVGFELNRDLDVQSSSSSLFIPHPYCRTSLTNFCVRLCTLIPRPLTNSKLGYAPGLLSHPSKYVSAFRNVCVWVRAGEGRFLIYLLLTLSVISSAEGKRSPCLLIMPEILKRFHQTWIINSFGQDHLG